MPDENLKLDKPEIIWGADQKIKGDINYYPAGFYKTPAVDICLGRMSRWRRLGKIEQQW